MKKAGAIKLTMDQSSAYEEEEIVVKYNEMSHTLDNLVNQIKLYSSSIVGKRGSSSYTILLSDIYYFESVENKTFIYVSDGEYEVVLKLYEIEEQLNKIGFIRISKFCILNLDRLTRVKGMLNGKFEAYLDNGEKVIITRHYAPEFKKRFGL